MLVNEYVLDPAHIAPSRTDANSNGHFPLGNNHIQAGTPRGFNLAATIPYFNGHIPGAFHAGNIPGFMGVNSPGFNGMMSGDGVVSHHGQPGVMRRGGGRYSNRSGPYDRRGGNRTGNYNSIYGNPQGRLSPIRGMPGMYGAGSRLPGGGGSSGFGMNNIPYVPPGHPAAAMVAGANGGLGPGGLAGSGGGGVGGGGGSVGNFPDGGSGHQAMGPREAVQGRSLKSYEDLDAVGGSGGGELNY